MKWRHSVASMFELISAICSWFVCQVQSRTELALEVVVLRHQLNVLRRQRPGRPRLRSFDRLLWVLAVPVVAAPSEEHRAGQTGNHRPVAPPRIPALLALAFPVGSAASECELRKLIREMSKANPLWGAPRIHGELLKLGIEFSQVTVAKYMVRRSGMPSPTWRSFLRNQGAGIAAI